MTKDQDRASQPAQSAIRRFLIPLAALIAVLPLIRHGCSCGHDFDFHLLSWMEAARQFAHGNLHPHWAFTPAYGAGEPRFVFYPPISWTLGALLGLLLTHLPRVSEAAAWNAVPILFTWIALTLSGLTMHRLARAFVGGNAALLCATLYLANPYMLFTAYERTAYAELLAAAWIPLLLHAILHDRITIPRIALPVALLWLTNAPAAVMGMYTLALLAALRVLGANAVLPDGRPNAGQAALRVVLGFAQPSRWSARNSIRDQREHHAKPSASHEVTAPRAAGPSGRTVFGLILKIAAGTILGLGLAAFYLIPAIFERRFVQIAMATIAGMRIDNNFLFERTGSSIDAILHDQVLHTASVVAVFLLYAAVIALAALAIRKIRQTGPVRQLGARPFPILPLAILTIGIGFLLTPASLFLWNHTPEAGFLQFPWRLLAILAPVAALSIAAALDRVPSRIAGPTAAPAVPPAAPGSTVPRSAVLGTAVLGTAVGVGAACLSVAMYRAFQQPCDAQDTATARLALFHSGAGTDPTDEYTPTTADNDSLTPGDPPYWLAGSVTASAAPPPPGSQPGPAPLHIRLAPTTAQTLVLNLRDFPAWRITRNGAPVLDREPRPDGLIALHLPAGASTLDLRYAVTPDQIAGDATTLTALGLLLLTLRKPRPARRADP